MARVVMGFVGVLFLVISLVRSWRSGTGDIDVDLWRFVSATLLLMGAGAGLARSWAAILADCAAAGDLLRGYMRAQPAKYIPGGWAQPVSQVVHATEGGAHVGRASAAYAVQAVCLLVSGASLGSGVSLIAGVPPTTRWVSLVGLLSVLLLSRRWMSRAIGLMGRLLRRADWDALVPGQHAIFRCFLWALGAIALMSFAFAILAGGSYRGAVSLLELALAFSLAWAIGFAVIPFPAGVGVREAVLVGLLGAFGTAPVAIGMSVVHRALQMVAELILVVLSRVGERKGSGHDSS